MSRLQRCNLEASTSGRTATAPLLRLAPRQLLKSVTYAPCPQSHYMCPPVWRCASAVGEAASTDASSDSKVADVDKELVREKAAAGMKKFSASVRKVGSARLVVDSLKRCSLTFIGDDHALSFAVAKVLGARLGWFPVDLPKVVCGMRKVASIDQLSAEDLAATEAEVLRGLRTQFRVIATPLPGAAVARDDTWRDLWGSVIVWIDEEDRARPKARTPERALYEERAELAVRVKLQKGFAVKGGNTLDNRAKAVAEALMPRLSEFLAEQPDLVDRKRTYVERGCRGDWPEVQPEGWSPVVQGLERKPLGGFEGQQQQQQQQPEQGQQS